MKNFKRVLSLVLALMMCVSMISLAAFAAEEEEKSDALFELNFEETETGKKLQDYPEYLGAASYLQPTNEIKEETKADGSTNKFWRLPFAGHCIVTSGGDGGGANFSGNCDKSLYAKHAQFDYTMGESLVIETSYRWDAKDVAPRLETQFANITAYKREGEGISANTSNGQWISLYNINGSTLALGNCGTLTGAGELIPGEWNTVRLIVDLAAGRYDTYVNGVLYATDAYLAQGGGSQDAGWCNVTVPQNKFIVAKMNKMLNTYSAQTVYDDWDVYFDVDDIKMYFTNDLVDVNVNGRDMKVFPNQELTFKKANAPFVYAEITDAADNTTINTTGKFTVDKAGYTIVAEYGSKGALAYEGYELLANEKWKAQAAAIYGATSLIGVANAWEVIEEIDAETVTAINSLKVKLTDAVNGKGITLRHAAVDAIKYPVVNLFSTVTPVAGAALDVKLGDTVLYSVKGTEIAGLTKAEGAPAIEAGKLADLKTVINLQKGLLSVYVLAEVVPEAPKAEETPAPAAEGDAAVEETPAEPVYEYVLYGTKDIAKAEIAENSLSFVINKDGAFVADSYMTIGAFALDDGDKVRVKLVWDRYSEAQYNKDGTPQLDADGNPVLKWFEQSSNNYYHVGTTYDLTREARSFQSAIITYPLAEGAEVAEQEVISVPALEITEKLAGASVELVYSLAISSATFENVTTDPETGVIKAGGDVNQAAHIYSAVREENGNKYIHVPYQGTAKAWNVGSGNYDKALKVAHPSISYEKTDVVVLEMDYRIHYVNLVKGTGTEAGKVYCGYTFDKDASEQPMNQIQLQKITHGTGDAKKTENWADLFSINVATGAITQVTAVEGAQNIAQDTWTKVKMVFDMTDGTFSVYTNDILYGTGKVNKGTADYVIEANTLFVAKCNKQNGAYKTLFAADKLDPSTQKEPALAEGEKVVVDNSENISYVDIDNVTFRYIEDRQITIDGTGKKVQETDIVDLTQEGKDLLFSTITLDGKTTVTTDTKIAPVNGMKIQRYTVSKFQTIGEEMLRVGYPTGVRFVTVVDQNFTNLIFNELGLTIKFGTIIAPAEAVKAAKEFTKAGLSTVDADGKVTATNYAEVQAIAGKTFYDRSIKDEIGTNYAYAGSIANIKEGNLTTKFMGRGFIEVYDGETLVASMYSAIGEEETGACISDLAWEYLDSKGSTLGPKFFEYLNSYVVEE